MRILIDECLDWRLKREFPGHAVSTVAEMGWSGLKNGALLALAQAQFDVFLTGDKNLTFQQQLANYSLSVVVLDAPSTRLADTIVLVPKVLVLLNAVSPGTATIVGP